MSANRALRSVSAAHAGSVASVEPFFEHAHVPRRLGHLRAQQLEFLLEERGTAAQIGIGTGGAGRARRGQIVVTGAATSIAGIVF